jgi:hypothetical protein
MDFTLKEREMFGFLDDAIDYVGKRVDEVIDDPIGEVVRQVTSPIVNTLDIIDGLTEGELRMRAAVRLGADVAGGMTASELVNWYQTENPK